MAQKILGEDPGHRGVSPSNACHHRYNLTPVLRLVQWIEQVSEHLNDGKVQPYAVVQIWEQLIAVGNLLSEVTVKLDVST